MKKVHKVVLFTGITMLMALSLSKMDVFATQNLENQVTESIIDEVNSDFEIVDGVLEFYSGTEAEVVIPDGVTEIGDFAFEYCRTMESVKIPDSVTKIGVRAFRNCTRLSTVEIPSSVTCVEDEAFYNSKWLIEQRKKTPLVIINNVVVDGYDCEGDVEIPEGITMISGYAFWNSKLKSVKIPNGVTEIGTEVFASCKNLESVELPNSVVSIGNSAFDCCISLRSIKIPESVTTIDYSAFSGCSSLADLEIPRNITSIATNAFSGTKWLENKRLENPLVISNGILVDGRTCEGNIEISSDVTMICGMAFSTCKGLTGVKIHNGITTIESATFSACSNLTIVEIPSSVTSIGSLAFINCKNLKTVKIPDSVVNIGNAVFSGAEQVTIYCNKDSVAHKYAIENKISFVLLDEGFDLKEDGHCVINDAGTFGYVSAWDQLFGIEKEYKVPLERYQEVYGPSITKEMHAQTESWSGNCFGMSATAVLFYKNSISLAPYLKEGTSTLTSGGYKKMYKGDDGKYYYKLKSDSELTKLIERYQIWQDSEEYLTDKKIDGETYNTWEIVLKKIEEKEPLILGVYWSEEGYGHALVVDSSRQPENLENGWYRIYLYDPNHPYFVGDREYYTPIEMYEAAEERYIDVNTNNGDWKIDVMLNANEGNEPITVGCINGEQLLNGRYVILDVEGYPTDFEKKATYFTSDANKTGIYYKGNDVKICDENNLVVYWVLNGKVCYKEQEVEEIRNFAYENDNALATGKIILPKGNYQVSLGSKGMVGFFNKDDYAGIVSEGKVEVENIDSTVLKLYGGEEKKVNIVLREKEGEEFVVVGTDVLISDKIVETSISDNHLKIEADTVQEIDLSITTDKSEHIVENISTDKVKDVALDTGKITGENVNIITVVPSPTEKPIVSTNDNIKVGSVVENKKEGVKYKVLSIEGYKGTVAYFKGNKNKKEVKIPKTVNIGEKKYKVVAVSANAFKNNNKLTKVVIGDNVKKIGAGAFSGCKQLKTVSMGENVSVIEKNAFYKCVKLQKIALPKNITKIGQKAFYGCKKLRKIVVKSQKVKQVGKKAFSGIDKKAVIKVPRKKLKEYKKKFNVKVVN